MGRWLILSVVLPVVLPAVLLLPAGVLSAQEDGGETAPRRATLLEGPNRVRGIHGLGPNALAAQRGLYELNDGTEVELFILSLVVERPDQWRAFACPLLEEPGISLNVTEEHGRPLYAYRSEEESRTLLGVGFPSDAIACDFIARFLEELSFFSSALQTAPLLPFPAVLTY